MIYSKIRIDLAGSVNIGVALCDHSFNARFALLHFDDVINNDVAEEDKHTHIEWFFCDAENTGELIGRLHKIRTFLIGDNDVSTDADSFWE